jgi:uncharacterized protein (DUF1330 family)
MPAFFERILDDVRVLEMRDTAWREEYAPKTVALVQKHDGKFLVRDGTRDVSKAAASCRAISSS